MKKQNYSFDKSNNSILNVFKVFIVSLKLGLTSFGGPIAHLGYFFNEYVIKRKWMNEKMYNDLVALCQFLPGPASSQFGIAMGTIRAGLLGGIMAWVGFTFPSAIFLILFAFLMKGFNFSNAGWIHGLKIVAVAIVAQAVFTMWQKIITDHTRAAIAILSMVTLLLWQAAYTQILIIVISGIIGLFLFNKIKISEETNIKVPVSRKFAIFCLILFLTLLICLPIARQVINNRLLSIADSFYRSGSLVFGGGHVVLPLLEKEVVPVGWISRDNFLAGYGATQAVPGPLFTFAGYLGAMIAGIWGAILALFSIFLPAYLLIIGALPFWNSFRNNLKVQGVLLGINSAVVGILLAALYNPLWTSAIFSPVDFGLLSILFAMLLIWRLPPWIIVIIGAAGGTLIEFLKKIFLII